MKIALLAPPWLPVPPKKYGGTESVVFNITEELVKRGHDVTLFSSGDSKSSAKIKYFYKKALGNNAKDKNNAYLTLPHYYNCFKNAEKYDIIHDHNDDLSLFFCDSVKTPTICTLHGSFEKKEVSSEKLRIVKMFAKLNFVSISKSQQRYLKGLNFVETIYNGIKLSDFHFSKSKGDYLFWIGRITRKKGLATAIKVAKKIGMKLIIAGSIEPEEKNYLEKEVVPFIDGKKIIFLGEVGLRQKAKLYRNAYCTLCPINWSEPFGLVFVESMACGTPVVAFRLGSAREVIKNEITGFTVPKEEGINGFVRAVKNVKEINRLSCRRHVEQNFTVEKMVDKYEELYYKLLGLDFFNLSYIKYN